MKRMKQMNFVKLLKGYEKPGWAGVAPDFSKVLYWGKTLKEVREQADKKKQRVYVFPTGRDYDNFIG